MGVEDIKKAHERVHVEMMQQYLEIATHMIDNPAGQIDAEKAREAGLAIEYLVGYCDRLRTAMNNSELVSEAIAVLLRDGANVAHLKLDRGTVLSAASHVFGASVVTHSSQS